MILEVVSGDLRPTVLNIVSPKREGLGGTAMLGGFLRPVRCETYRLSLDGGPWTPSDLIGTSEVDTNLS